MGPISESRHRRIRVRRVDGDAKQLPHKRVRGDLGRRAKPDTPEGRTVLKTTFVLDSHWRAAGWMSDEFDMFYLNSRYHFEVWNTADISSVDTVSYLGAIALRERLIQEGIFPHGH